MPKGAINAKIKAITKNTLLIFDEIQECPNIISSLKYFCQNHREIPVIATGSMVRIKIKRNNNKRGAGEQKEFLFPVGKIDEMTLYPMTFDEFLMNTNELLYNKVFEFWEKKLPLDNQIHQMVMDYVYRYLLIGGMPEAVQSYITYGDLNRTRKILTSLYNNYLSDMELYQASPEAILRSRNLFSHIYHELNRETKNFSPSLIESKAKNRDFATSIEWLTLAHIVNQSFQLKEHVTTPLIKNDDGNFRLFLCDIGMFSYQSGINAASFISTDRENTLSGIFFENFVASELIAKGNNLYYWKGKSSCELEFIVESGNKLFPIDVKKGRGTLNSIKKFADHNKYEFAIKISKNNYGFDDESKLMTVPFYYVPFLAEDLKIGRVVK